MMVKLLEKKAIIHADCEINGSKFGKYTEVGCGSIILNSNFGDYSVNLFMNIEEFDDGFDEGYDQARALFDMAAVAIVKNPSWAIPTQISSPELIEGVWKDRPENPRKITLWENFDKKEIMEDSSPQGILIYSCDHRI